ncbi:glycosyltransferase family 4 protein [Christiangramia echinicola]|uniref:Glycosyltransferase involved in cell wall bisynthesis n=1 Tax=Christiangramia echinicola TaxID=279359 RepID=A0A1H1QPK8_9FLAO|nr:glycosyltransferase family 4 protein [Christiangramia echinicola]SDS25277.1 Glycosyltransferase involved in cell wall bisynthesis [Christiangramia echinicola]
MIKKYLAVQDSLGTGGAERSNAELWDYLKKCNVQIKIIVLRHRIEGVEKEILEKGFDVHFLQSGILMQQAKTIAKIIENFEPDIVHSVLFKASLRVRMAKLFTRFYHIESLVTMPYAKIRLNDPSANKFYIQIFRGIDLISKYFGVDHFHANGETVANHYFKKLRIKKSKISVIPRGRKVNYCLDNPGVIGGLRNEFNSKNHIQIIHVARHEYPKGQDILLDAFGRLVNIKEKFKVLLVGRDGKLTKKIKHKIEEFGLGNSIHIVGHRGDIYELLASSDIFVFPSRFEGLPGALIEAEAAGLPIICSDIPNNLEVIEENRNALVFKNEDPVSLAENLNKLIMDKEKRLEMGKESLRIYKERFQIETVNKRMLNLFIDLTSKY